MSSQSHSDKKRSSCRKLPISLTPPAKRRRLVNDRINESAISSAKEKDKKSRSSLSVASSNSRNKFNTDNHSTSSISKYSSKTLPSNNSSYDRKSLFSNTIPRKQNNKSFSHQSDKHPTHIVVQNKKNDSKKSQFSWGSNNDLSGWTKKKPSPSSGWANSSRSSGRSNHQQDKNCNPFEPKKSTSYGGWLPTFYKGPPITSEKSTPSKNKKPKEQLNVIGNNDCN